MITNKMRFQLSMLGYDREEMKHLTPEQCWEIINKEFLKSHQGKEEEISNEIANENEKNPSIIICIIFIYLVVKSKTEENVMSN